MRKKRLKAEKRKAERLPIPLKVKYKSKKSRPLLKEAVYENISGLGIRLSVSEPLERGDVIEVLISHSHIPKSFNTVCRVCWCKRLKEDRFQAGLEFLKVKNRLQFINFLCAEIMNSSLKCD